MDSIDNMDDTTKYIILIGLLLIVVLVLYIFILNI